MSALAVLNQLATVVIGFAIGLNLYNAYLARKNMRMFTHLSDSDAFDALKSVSKSSLRMVAVLIVMLALNLRLWDYWRP